LASLTNDQYKSISGVLVRQALWGGENQCTWLRTSGSSLAAPVADNVVVVVVVVSFDSFGGTLIALILAANDAVRVNKIELRLVVKVSSNESKVIRLLNEYGTNNETLVD